MEYLLTSAARRVSGPFLRVSLAIILAWIGVLKFVDPSPVVGLLQASLPAVNVIAMVPMPQMAPTVPRSMPVEVH